VVSDCPVSDPLLKVGRVACVLNIDDVTSRDDAEEQVDVVAVKVNVVYLKLCGVGLRGVVVRDVGGPGVAASRTRADLVLVEA
jgi:ribosomal protein L35AE/L33A